MAIPREITTDELKYKFEGAKTVIHEYGNLAEDTVNFKLNPETWSCTEVCQHLIRFNEIYLKQINKALQNKNEMPLIRNSTSFSPGWASRKLAGYMEPPYKFGIKTIKPMLPSNIEMSASDTFISLIQIEDKLIDILQTAEDSRWNLDKIKGHHPILKFLKMSLTDFIIFIDAHQRRHFWQIEQILKRIPE